MSLVIVAVIVSSAVFSVSAGMLDPFLEEEQKEELKELKEEFREETIVPLLAEYGIVQEEDECRCDLRDSIDALTEEERIELFESLRNAKEEFRENVIQPKLEEWDIPLPEFGEGDGRMPRGGRRSFRGGIPFRGGHPGGFGMEETASN